MVDVFDPDVVKKIELAFLSRERTLHDALAVQHPDFEMTPRRFHWVNLQEMKFADGGWRAQRDFARFRLAVDAYVRAAEAGVYMPNMSGEVCGYCPHQGHCAGTGIADEEEGKP